MKKWLVFSFFFILSVFFTEDLFSMEAFCPEEGLLVSPSEPLSLKGMLKLAVEQNPDMEEAKAKISEAEALFKESASALWPSFGLSLSWIAGDAPSSYLFQTIDQRKLPEDVNFNKPGSFHNTEIGLWASMRLFDGGRSGLLKNMADIAHKESLFAMEDVKNRLAFAIVQAFYHSMAAKDLLEVSRESLVTVKEQLRLMEVQYQGGAVLKSDLLALGLRLAESREEIIRDENRLSVSLSALSALLGFCPGDKPLVGEDDLSFLTLPLNGEEAMQLAVSARPELKKAALSLERLFKGVKAENRRFLPELNLRGRYWHDDRDLAFDKDRENWEVALVADWEIFDGFARKAGKDMALARQKAMRAKSQAILLDLRLDVERALSGLSEADARYEVAKSAVGLAEESFDLVRAQYEGGALPVVSYLQSELDYKKAKTRKIAAFYDKKKARADLARALGLLLREV